MTEPKIKVGQEWEKTSASGVTRIRIAEVSAGRAGVATVTSDGRLIRGRRILMSALTNTASGYRLVKDMP